MFQFRAFPPYAYFIQRTVRRYCLRGFPHSDISGSTDICSSPKLFAACHVLRRLLMPRHSPCALFSLTASAFADSVKRYLVLLNYAGILIRVISCKIDCYPSFPQSFPVTSVTDPLLPCFLLFPLCSVFKVQMLRLDHREIDYTSRFARRVTSLCFETRSQNTITCVLRSNCKLELVGPSGLEPPTLRLSVVRSSQLSYGPVGGDSRVRTGDLLLARQALSQLS